MCCCNSITVAAETVALLDVNGTVCRQSIVYIPTDVAT